MKVLLFDIDGTLVRAGGAGRKALNHAARNLYGKSDVCSEFSLAGRTDLWNFHAAYKLAVGRKGSARQVKRLHREYLRLLPRYVRRAWSNGTYEFPAGIKALLKRLSTESGVLLGLGTGNIESGARIKLGPSGFNRYFRFGGFGTDSLHREVILKKAFRRASKLSSRRLLHENVYVIGDTPYDVMAGRKAGFKTIAVGTGFAAWDSLRKSKPDHLARDFRGILKWFKWFGLAA